MYLFYEIPGFICTTILLAVLLRCRVPLKLPLVLAIAPVLMCTGYLWGIAQLVIGEERLQALLLQTFPEANHPDGPIPYVIGDTEIGMVYWGFMSAFNLIKTLGWLLLGIGLLLYVNRLARELHIAHYIHSANHD